MKKFKKLVPALCMLLVSAIALGSSTFAWFSMNDNVTANGMQVNAVANTTYLVIADNANLTKTGAATTDSEMAAVKDAAYGMNIAGAEEAENKTGVYPVKYNSTGAAIELTNVKDVETNKVSVPAKNWYTANSTKYDSANGGVAEEVSNVKVMETASEDLKSYVLKYTFYIGLAKGSAETAQKYVEVEPTFTNNDNKELCALVVIGTEELAFDNNGTRNTKVKTTNKVELKAYSDSAANGVLVTVYLYVDGSVSTVNSKDFTSLTGNLSLKLTISD